MQINELKRKSPRIKSRQVGRGGKRGTTSGKGTKGQKARAGRKLRPELRDIIKKLPKKRGYRFAPVFKKAISINLTKIDQAFMDGETVSFKTLITKRLVKRIGGDKPRVKILSTGELTKKNLVFSGCLFSKVAEEKIKTAGGRIEA